MKTKLCSNCGCMVYEEEINCPDCSAVVFQSKNKKEEITMTHKFKVGNIVQHFKRFIVTEDLQNKNYYLYKILAFAEHTETGESLVIYQALYDDFKIHARPEKMFNSKIEDKWIAKHPELKYTERFSLATL